MSNLSVNEEKGEPFVEIDPTGRYGRYSDRLGSGGQKIVYRAFDQEEGIEVAWNQVKLCTIINDKERLDGLFTEVRLLQTLSHEHILSCYNMWINNDRGYLNFITEVCTSGNLIEYRNKHKHVSLKAIKKWARQILRGLEYLHTHEPCIIHRDLNCSNIFVNGNIGEVKIGDFGLVLEVKGECKHSAVGTAEFMAPELYEENYDETVDIYSFGLCVLEMITLELPHMECKGRVDIYLKVSSGVRPMSMNKVKDPHVRAFIEKCLGEPWNRPSASQLLQDSFFARLDNDDENRSSDFS